ncbi:DUF6445 family protein [Sphingopyxis sp.]|uniref:DUF6445 family protein n=1 Tax=Sphingopyxis sp. TaxID=1908224 RepID=UPI002B4697AE|nr:DUF6445 family protein [Sphingopyxis sp.]HJS12801.1 DUF6445 family protein [Sphingopyxis sp.]
MTAATVCQPADTAVIDVLAIGGERVPLIRIDGATTDPQALVDFACNAVAFAPVADNLYPGWRAPMPLDYVRAMVARLDPLVRRVYGIGQARLVRAECFFSIVATPAAALVPLQTVPHIDTSDPLHFATVHYLCPAHFGGTGFFRQLSTGFETISPDREAAWDRARDAALATHRSRGYPSERTADHVRVAAVPAAFDRLILYRSNALHAGIIDPSVDHPADPRTGRLTATMFIAYRRATAPPA